MSLVAGLRDVLNDYYMRYFNNMKRVGLCEIESIGTELDKETTNGLIYFLHKPRIYRIVVDMIDKH